MKIISERPKRGEGNLPKFFAKRRLFLGLLLIVTTLIFLGRSERVSADCTPDCAGKECGPDGCGGSCGTCNPGEVCNPAGQCVPGSCDVCSLSVGDTITFEWNEPSDPGSATVSDYRWAIDDSDPDDGGWSGWQTERTSAWGPELGDDGPHTFYVQARDSLGNEGSVGSVPFGVDCGLGPVVTLEVDECTRTQKARPYWWWSADPRCAPALDPDDPYYYRFDANNDAVIDDQGYTTGTSYTPSVDLSDGYHTLYVQAIDSCGVAGDVAEAEAFVDATPPAISLACSRGPDSESLYDCSLVGEECSVDNVALWNWSASDPGTYASGLRTEDTYYVQSNFAGSYYTTETSWGPNVVPDTNERTTPTHWLKVSAFDACANMTTVPDSEVDELKIDTKPPWGAFTEPANRCYHSEDVATTFRGTATDDSCWGVVDVDIRIERDPTSEYWDSSDWSATEIWHDTSLNEVSPALNNGLSWDWNYTPAIDWSTYSSWSSSQEESFNMCLRGRDDYGYVQDGGTYPYSCQELVVDDILPRCGDAFIVLDSTTNGPVTTESAGLLITMADTEPFYDPNCELALYMISIYRGGIGEGFRYWGTDGPITQVDYSCQGSMPLGYPNNTYNSGSMPPSGTMQDGDIMEICFDVEDCAGNRASENDSEDCPLISDYTVTSDGICQYIYIQHPSWLQAQGGGVCSHSEDEETSIYSLVPGEAVNPEPYFILPPDDLVFSKGEINLGYGQTSESDWRILSYPNSLYTAKPMDYDYIWGLYGSPESAPEFGVQGNNLCHDSGAYELINDTYVCKSSGDLSLEGPPDTPLRVQSGRQTLVFVNGNLQINRKVQSPDDGVIIFVVKGNIYVDWKLESLGSDDPILKGVFIASQDDVGEKGQFVSAQDTTKSELTCDPEDSENTCEFDPHNDPLRSDDPEPGNRAVFEGIYISYGGFKLTPPYGRNLKACIDGRTECNRNTPAELFIFNENLFDNLPDLFKEQPYSWAEVKP